MDAHTPPDRGIALSARTEARTWLLIGAGFALFVWVFQAILLPFVAAMAIAYFLDPIADRLVTWRVPRGIAAIGVLTAFLLVMVAVILLIVPLLQAQIIELVERVPGYLAILQARVLQLAERLEARLAPEDMARLREALTAHAGSAFGWLTGVLGGLIGGGLALFNVLALIFVTPVIAFYVLRDWDRMLYQIDRLLPRQHAPEIRHQLALVDRTLAGFVRGQAIVCLLLGTFYALALTAVGLDFGFAVGLLAGLVSFIPYVGSTFGLVTSVGLALIQFDEWWRVLLVAAIFFGGQAVEGNVLTPKLVGDRVGLHPVWVIFALFAGGALFGFLGMMLALPVAAVIGVLVRYTVQRYQASGLYSGPPAPNDACGEDGK